MTPQPTSPRTDEKRCRICDQAHWRAPEGWTANHVSEPVDRPVKEAAAEPTALLRALVEAIDPPEGGDFTARSFRELKAAIAAARAYLEGQE